MPVLLSSISSAVVIPATSGVACTGEKLLEGDPLVLSSIGATRSMAVVLMSDSAMVAAGIRKDLGRAQVRRQRPIGQCNRVFGPRSERKDSEVAHCVALVKKKQMKSARRYRILKAAPHRGLAPTWAGPAKPASRIPGRSKA